VLANVLAFWKLATQPSLNSLHHQQQHQMEQR